MLTSRNGYCCLRCRKWNGLIVSDEDESNATKWRSDDAACFLLDEAIPSADRRKQCPSVETRVHVACHKSRRRLLEADKSTVVQ